MWYLVVLRGPQYIYLTPFFPPLHPAKQPPTKVGKSSGKKEKGRIPLFSFAHSSSSSLLHKQGCQHNKIIHHNIMCSYLFSASSQKQFSPTHTFSTILSELLFEPMSGLNMLNFILLIIAHLLYCTVRLYWYVRTFSYRAIPAKYLPYSSTHYSVCTTPFLVLCVSSLHVLHPPSLLTPPMGATIQG